RLRRLESNGPDQARQCSKRPRQLERLRCDRRRRLARWVDHGVWSRAGRASRVSSRHPWIMMRSATDLGKADLHVFSKLFDDGLERGQEAKAFSGRQIGGHEDVLEFFVGHLINVEMTRQPAP